MRIVTFVLINYFRTRCSCCFLFVSLPIVLRFPLFRIPTVVIVHLWTRTRTSFAFMIRIRTPADSGYVWSSRLALCFRLLRIIVNQGNFWFFYSILLCSVPTVGNSFCVEYVGHNIFECWSLAGTKNLLVNISITSSCLLRRGFSSTWIPLWTKNVSTRLPKGATTP